MKAFTDSVLLISGITPSRKSCHATAMTLKDLVASTTACGAPSSAGLDGLLRAYNRGTAANEAGEADAADAAERCSPIDSGFVSTRTHATGLCMPSASAGRADAEGSGPDCDAGPGLITRSANLRHVWFGRTTGRVSCRASWIVGVDPTRCQGLCRCEARWVPDETHSRLWSRVVLTGPCPTVSPRFTAVQEHSADLEPARAQSK